MVAMFGAGLARAKRAIAPRNQRIGVCHAEAVLKALSLLALKV
jgi:hypothetical protein